MKGTILVSVVHAIMKILVETEAVLTTAVRIMIGRLRVEDGRTDLGWRREQRLKERGLWVREVQNGDGYQCPFWYAWMRLTLGERSAIGVPAAMKKKGALTFPGVGIERGSGCSMHRMRILSPN